MAERALDMHEAAEYLGVQYDTLREMRGQGYGPRFIVVGGKNTYLFDVAALEIWKETVRSLQPAGWEIWRLDKPGWSKRQMEREKADGVQNDSADAPAGRTQTEAQEKK